MTESTEVFEEPLGPIIARTSPGRQSPLMPYMICMYINHSEVHCQEEPGELLHGSTSSSHVFFKHLTNALVRKVYIPKQQATINR